MPRSRLILGLAAALLLPPSARAIAQSPPPLRVIRTTPSGDANALSQITVTFDRPVAGSLDRTVDPASVLRVEPSIPGRLEWRDPVTIRLTPSTALQPGASYTVTVANTFRSMDGGALAAPYQFTIRVRGPMLLGGSPVSNNHSAQITLDQKFEVVYSSAVDLARLSTAAYLEFQSSCSAMRIIRLRATQQRRLDDREPFDISQAGGFNRDRSLDSLRRVVTLVPEVQLPHGCAGDIVLPTEAIEGSTAAPSRYVLETYGDLHLAKVACSRADWCPRGPIELDFTTPVSGAQVLRNIHIAPEAKFAISDTLATATRWVLDARLEPRVTYAVFADTSLRDVYGQSIRGNPAGAVRTTGYAPSVNYSYGHLLVERQGLRSLAIQHVNVDTLIAVIAPIPPALEPKVASRFGWATDTVWTALMRGATTERIPVKNTVDRASFTNLRLPVSNARRPGSPALYAVKVSARSNGRETNTDGPIAVVQVTNLGVHAKVGENEGVVWVTGANDGLAREGATVELYDTQGRLRATSKTDARGLAHLAGWDTALPKAESNAGTDEGGSPDVEGYVKVTLGDDRAITNINNWDNDLSPWQFNVYPAWGDSRLPLAGAVFTERGIYRPGERVFAKAIVRDGPLGALRAAPAGDSLKWRFSNREGQVLRETTTRLTAFGTSSQTFDVPANAAVGYYGVDALVKRHGAWRSVGRDSYRVAEYRPPEFLVDVTGDKAALAPGDNFSATVQARYLFGAPMGRAVVTWNAQQRPMSPWELQIPGTEGWWIGETGGWWEDASEDPTRVFASATDTLDVRGVRKLTVKLPEPLKGRPARVTLDATVIDVNRQVVGASTSTTIHPAAFYVAVRPTGKEYFWKVGTPQSVEVMAVRPNGDKVAGVAVHGTIVRREWHRVRRERNGISEVVGDWVSDTVGTCNVTTNTPVASCTLTPASGGTYILTFRAKDSNGREAVTDFQRWSVGSDWVPWSDESQFKMDVIPDKSRYSVGDTATVLFASPFTNAEAWVTVEREGLIEQRRIRITSGSTTLKFPITEAYAPNAFVSIIVARGRSAPPGPADDPGRPTIRVGYAEIRVTPETKRLAVKLALDKPDYRPGDSVHVRINVRDARGHGGPRSEVTLWAVDEGVLALTDYKTPDPIDLVYRERGLGMKLGSNMTAVAPQVPEGEKGRRAPGGGGGAAGADVLRSRFQTTAFYLATVVTDAQGDAVAAARLPDNLTTFRVMAVAVTAGDRYGKGDTEMLVTRPLLARQALPRFVRPGDDFVAGAVINRRDGAAEPVHVRAQASGVTLRGDAEQTVTLAPQRGTEVRFPFLALHSDTATFRFDVTSNRPGEADAVRVSLPVRPEYHPRAHTVAGTMQDSASVEIALPSIIDPSRSTVTINLGTSPLATIRGMTEALHVYPYYCSEQVVSTATPIIALYRVQRQTNVRMLTNDPRVEIERAVNMLERRQRTDGGIGYWSNTDWSTAWLSAYAGMVLLDARDVGVKVDTLVLSQLADYVRTELHQASHAEDTPVANWYQSRMWRLRDQVAAADFLSRFGRPDIAAENDLLRTAAMLSYEDRVRLAQVLARRGQLAPARELMVPSWAAVRIEGRRAVITDTLPDFYFASAMRPYARLLTATLAIDPNNPLIGPLVETLADIGHENRRSWMWNTQDYASAVSALAAFDLRQRTSATRTVRVESSGQQVFQSVGAGKDSTVALTGLLTDAQNGKTLRLSLRATPGEEVVFYYVTVNEIPLKAPVTPEDAGIKVERWYERYDTGAPITSAAEGDVVRVRLRVTVPSERRFLVLDDALPAGLEAIDLSLRTASANPGPGVNLQEEQADHAERDNQGRQSSSLWSYGYWDSGWWSPFDHRELRDDRVVYSATVLWPGTYTASYLARATTAGTFIKPPAHAEEMYNPGVNGRSDGGSFIVTQRKP